MSTGVNCIHVIVMWWYIVCWFSSRNKRHLESDSGQPAALASAAPFVWCQGMIEVIWGMSYGRLCISHFLVLNECSCVLLCVCRSFALCMFYETSYAGRRDRKSPNRGGGSRNWDDAGARFVRFGEVPGFAGFLLELSGFQMSVASCFCLCGCSLCCSSTRCLGLSAGLGSQFDCLQFFAISRKQAVVCWSWLLLWQSNFGVWGQVSQCLGEVSLNEPPTSSGLDFAWSLHDF